MERTTPGTNTAPWSRPLGVQVRLCTQAKERLRAKILGTTPTPLYATRISEKVFLTFMMQSFRSYPDNLNNPLPNKPRFLLVCSTSLLKTLWGKEKLLVKSNFFFFSAVFFTFMENFLIFSLNLKLSYANSFILKESKLCCLGEGYYIRAWTEIDLMNFSIDDNKIARLHKLAPGKHCM